MSLGLGMLLSLGIILLGGFIMAGIVILLRNLGGSKSAKTDSLDDKSAGQ